MFAGGLHAANNYDHKLAELVKTRPNDIVRVIIQRTVPVERSTWCRDQQRRGQSYRWAGPDPGPGGVSASFSVGKDGGQPDSKKYFGGLSQRQG